jgi:hypothetical protein
MVVPPAKLVSSLVGPVQERQASPARHGVAIIRGDPLDLGSMSRFLVAWIAQHHAIVVESVQVAFLSLVFGHPWRPQTVSERFCA